jgi:hypothetical protein
MPRTGAFGEVALTLQSLLRKRCQELLAIVAAGAHDAGVGFHFVSADRGQQFLLPPDMAEWLPEDHLVWFVIDVVDQIDLDRFRRSYRSDGHGRPAYDPAMMVALLLYAYCGGVRSSRVIERRCVEDIAYRVLAGNHRPDHVTIARFRQRTPRRWPRCSSTRSGCAPRRAWSVWEWSRSTARRWAPTHRPTPTRRWLP